MSMNERPKLDPKELRRWDNFRDRHARAHRELVANLRAENAKLREEIAAAPPLKTKAAVA
jgi:hypothetical protein